MKSNDLYFEILEEKKAWNKNKREIRHNEINAVLEAKRNIKRKLKINKREEESFK